jgi:hypothetical protein
MTSVIEDIRKFLEDARYEWATLTQGPIKAVAQNESIILFIVDAVHGIEAAVDQTLNLLIRPFKSKSFGPKSSEMYAVFIAEPNLSATEIERYEQDVRICRKIIIIDSADIDQRLTFLTPLDNSVAKTSNVEGLFWSDLGSQLTESETAFLQDLNDHDLKVDDVQQRFSDGAEQ